MNVTIHNYGRKVINEKTGNEEYVFSNEVIENKLSVISKNLMPQFVWGKEGLVKEVESPKVSVRITYKDNGLSETVINVYGFGMNIHTEALGNTEENSFNNALQKIMNQLSHRKGKKNFGYEGIKDIELAEEYTSIMRQLDIFEFKMSMQKNANEGRYNRAVEKYNDYMYSSKLLEDEINSKQAQLEYLKKERDAVTLTHLNEADYAEINEEINSLRQNISDIEVEIASSLNEQEIIDLMKQKGYYESKINYLMAVSSNPKITKLTYLLPRIDDENISLLDSSIEELVKVIRELSLKLSKEEYQNDELLKLDFDRAKQHLRTLLYIRYNNAATVEESIAQLEYEIMTLNEQLDDSSLTKKDSDYMDKVIDEEFELNKLLKKI